MIKINHSTVFEPKIAKSTTLAKLDGTATIVTPVRADRQSNKIYRAPKIKLPIRTMVLPSSTAISQSPDIPMDISLK